MPWQCDAVAVAGLAAATVADHLLDLAAAAAAAAADGGGEGGGCYHLQQLRAGGDGCDATIRQYQQLQ